MVCVGFGNGGEIDVAKGKSPLLSFGATGKLGNTLVYSRWKNLFVIKSKVDPTNPSTAAQETQRSIYGAAVEFWRTTEFNEHDIAAFRLWSRRNKVKGTEYNMVVKLYNDCIIAGEDWRECRGIVVGGLFPTNPTVKIDGDASKTLNLFWGTSPGGLEDLGAMDQFGDNWQMGVGGLTVGVPYYFTFKGDGVQQTGLYRWVCGPFWM